MAATDVIFQSFETVWLILLYGWPFMLLAMIPVLTSMVGFIKTEQMKSQQRIVKANTQQMNSIINGFNYGG